MPEKKDHSELEGKLRTLISENLGADESDITNSASFEYDLKADSLDRIELVMTIEEAFDIQIADEDVDDIKTFKDAVEYVAKKLAGVKKRA